MLEANATAKDVLYLAKPDLVDETMPKAKAKGRPTKFVSKVEKGQLFFKMTKDSEPTMEKCVICGLGADVILEEKSMVRICHRCQEVTAATSDTQPPAVPGSGAASGGGALEVPDSGAAGGGCRVDVVVVVVVVLVIVVVVGALSGGSRRKHW